MDYDVVIVGGSANGSQTARMVASYGLRVLVIEEHPRIGMPEHCSGLFSYYGLERMDAIPPSDIIFNQHIYGSRLVAPNGKTLTVRKNEPHAMVTDRAAFDSWIADQAKQNGAEYLIPYRAMKATRDSDGVTVEAVSRDREKVILKSRMIVSAEGIRGTIASQMGLRGPPIGKFINAAQFFMDGLNNLDPQLVEVYQTQQYAHGFFGWVIPMSDTSAKVGLGTTQKAAAKKLEVMLESHPVMKERTSGAEITRKIAGRIPPTGPVKKTYGNNILLVGDVAGQTKPTTGGGVILGGIASHIAAKVIQEAVAENDFSSKFLSRYQRRWKKEMYRNLWLQRRVRNYINNLSDKSMNQFFDILERRGLLAKIEEHGHVDNQGALAVKLLLTPSLYPYFISTFPAFIKSFF